MRHLLGTAVTLLVLTCIFALLERRWAARPGGSFLERRGKLTDIGYWFGAALVVPSLHKLAAALAIVPIALALGAPPHGEGLREWVHAHRTFLAGQPAALQAAEILLLADLVGYWIHRLLHRGPFWRFHAVHHSSTSLDWLSSVAIQWRASSGEPSSSRRSSCSAFARI